MTTNPIQFTQEQSSAIEAEAPQLIIAGAGSGKTTVLTEKIVRLLREDPSRAEHILGLTFTDKAAGEMAERVRLKLQEAGVPILPTALQISTFHSFGSRIIHENMVRLGLNPGFRLLTRGMQWQLISEFFDDMTFDAIDLSLSVGNVFSNFLNFFSQAKDHSVTPDLLREFLFQSQPDGLSEAAAGYWTSCRAQWAEMHAVYDRYEQELTKQNLIDFGDEIVLPIALFDAHPQIRDKYRARYQYIFVDEYQDTNAAQRDLLMSLINSEKPNVVVIGDDDQAIYQWRGAMVENILRFPYEAVFDPGSVQVSTISQNRRSYPPVLELAGAVISGVENRYSKELTYYHSQQPGEAGYYTAYSRDSEAQWIAQRIESLHSWAEGLEEGKKGWGAFAVLCRKKSLFPALAAALDAAKIPYELIGGTGFYGRPEIKDVLSYLMLVSDPGDNVAMARILLSKRFRFSDRDIYFLGQWKKKAAKEAEEAEDQEMPVALIDALAHADEIRELTPDTVARLKRLKEDIEDFIQQSAKMSIPGLVMHVLNRTGYITELQSDPDSEAKIALLNLQKLVDLASEFQLASTKSSLPAFVMYVQQTVESKDDVSEVRPIDEASNTVKVMTVHQSKGLEFPCVFIPGLAKGLFPDTGRFSIDKYYQLPVGLRADSDTYPDVDLESIRTDRDIERAEKAVKELLRAKEMEEERRLAYVALTRAQYKLFFSRALWYGTTVKERPASVFWDELVNTGKAMDLGSEEEEPEILARRQAAEGENRERSLARMLLNEDEARKWLEDIISGDTEGRWEAMKQETDDIIERVSKGSGAAREAEPEPSLVFSYSALSSYQECPRKYQYLYLDRLPTKPAPWATLGTNVHERIRQDSIGQHVIFQPDFDELTGSDEWGAGEPGEDERSLFEKYKNSVYGQRAPKYVEQPFTLRLGDVVIKGRIDRIDELPDGAWEIVDFKTSVQPKTKKQAFHDLQLRIYALAAREIWGIEESRLTCTLYYLRHSKAVSVKFTHADLESTVEEIMRLTDAINERKFPQRMDTTRCRYCDFVHICGWFGEK